MSGALTLLACANGTSDSIQGGSQDSTESGDDAGAKPKTSGKTAAPAATPPPVKEDAGMVDAQTAPPPPPPPHPDAGTEAGALAPSVNSLSPSSIPAASAADTTLTVLGSNFITGAKVKFGAVDLMTTFNGPGSLTAKIPSASLTTPSSVPITVVNPAPSAGVSAPVAFTISNAVVTITTITPATATAGSPDVALTVNGTGFASTAKVSFNGTALGTNFVSAAQLTASIPASALTTAGNFSVVVTSGGGVSAPANFTVLDSKPSFDTFSPGSLPAGSPSTYVTLNGRGFNASSKVSVNGYIATTLFDSATELRALVQDYDLATAGTVPLRIYNTSGTGTVLYADNVGNLTVQATAATGPTAPTFTSYTPSEIASGSDDTYVTIYGSNFDFSTGVSVDGSIGDVIYDSSTQIRVLLTSTDLFTPTTIALRIYNESADGLTNYYASASGSIDVY